MQAPLPHRNPGRRDRRRHLRALRARQAVPLRLARRTQRLRPPQTAQAVGPENAPAAGRRLPPLPRPLRNRPGVARGNHRRLPRRFRMIPTRSARVSSRFSGPLSRRPRLGGQPPRPGSPAPPDEAVPHRLQRFGPPSPARILRSSSQNRQARIYDWTSVWGQVMLYSTFFKRPSAS